jgi:hypothetical protein
MPYARQAFNLTPRTNVRLESLTYTMTHSLFRLASFPRFVVAL